MQTQTKLRPRTKARELSSFSATIIALLVTSLTVGIVGLTIDLILRSL